MFEYNRALLDKMIVQFGSVCGEVLLGMISIQICIYAPHSKTELDESKLTWHERRMAPEVDRILPERTSVTMR